MSKKKKNHTNTSTEYTIKVVIKVELQEYIAYVNSEWLKIVYEDN